MRALSLDFRSGVAVLRTSSTLEKPVTMRLSGETCLWSLPALSFQLVRMDMESLPTGIQIPKAGQSSMPTALTVS